MQWGRFSSLPAATQPRQKKTMSSPDQPTVFLFDIGGVVVTSPFQVILDYELSLGIPPGWINYSISKTAPSGWWHRLERGQVPLDSDFYRGFHSDLHDAARWRTFYVNQLSHSLDLPRDLPPVPALDTRWLFDEMMAASATPDPWMFPAVQKLRASGKYILAAVSNTIILPTSHALHEYGDSPYSSATRELFDVFVSSAHVGLRKPDPGIYTLTLDEINRWTSKHRHKGDNHSQELWHLPVRPEDVVFLDDIGENLKAGKKLGFRTIKVDLGRAYQAVDELEKITGLKLAGDHPRMPVRPRFRRGRSKL